MNRIDKKMADLKASNRTALVPYIAAGDPEISWTADMMHALVESGADMIELGLAFSDPMADGPTIQLAYERIVAKGISAKDVFSQVAKFREKDTTTPVILMGYLNSIEVMGNGSFCDKASTAGVDALLVVDLPPEEAQPLQDAMRPHGMHQIFLVAPTTTDERTQLICNAASGFVYYVSMKGVTGSAAADSQDIKQHVLALKKHTSLPIAVGFGIRDAASAKAVSSSADAVVIGSALVAQLAECKSLSEATETIHAFLQPVSQAI